MSTSSEPAKSRTQNVLIGNRGLSNFNQSPATADSTEQDITLAGSGYVRTANQRYPGDDSGVHMQFRVDRGSDNHSVI